MNSNLSKSSKHALLIGLAFQAIMLCFSTRAADQETFNSPQEAVNVMVTASETHDTNSLYALFGPEGHRLVSPDAVQAAEAYQMFIKRLREKVVLVTNSDSCICLFLGNDNWPFPIPLEKQDGQWLFDTEAGREEILNRRIGMDELGAIAVCRAYVNAQHEYASQDRNGGGILEYAKYLHSDPGTHNGLYWPAQPGEPLSPLGPLIAAAHSEGYHHAARMISEQQAPYHGYYFKVLTRQGKHAVGGKYDYIINGHMIAGFALVAWPVEWRNTGVMTFIVNQQGKIYQCNLGPKTAKIAASMKEFEPDQRWTPAQ